LPVILDLQSMFFYAFGKLDSFLLSSFAANGKTSACDLYMVALVGSHMAAVALGTATNPCGGCMLYLSGTRIVGESLIPCGRQLAVIPFIPCLQ
jgi:hypothetical protein